MPVFQKLLLTYGLCYLFHRLPSLPPSPPPTCPADDQGQGWLGGWNGRGFGPLWYQGRGSLNLPAWPPLPRVYCYGGICFPYQSTAILMYFSDSFHRMGYYSTSTYFTLPTRRYENLRVIHFLQTKGSFLVLTVFFPISQPPLALLVNKWLLNLR